MRERAVDLVEAPPLGSAGGLQDLLLLRRRDVASEPDEQVAGDSCCARLLRWGSVRCRPENRQQACHESDQDRHAEEAVH